MILTLTDNGSYIDFIHVINECLQHSDRKLLHAVNDGQLRLMVLQSDHDEPPGVIGNDF